MVANPLGIDMALLIQGIFLLPELYSSHKWQIAEPATVPSFAGRAEYIPEGLPVATLAIFSHP